jgi:hypothetical protein
MVGFSPGGARGQGIGASAGLLAQFAGLLPAGHIRLNLLLAGALATAMAGLWCE